MSAFASQTQSAPTVDSKEPPPAEVLPYKPKWSAEDLGPEPFGQAGVRQHMGRWLMYISLICGILAAAMWYRSTFFYDIAQWRGEHQAINVRSIHSSFIIDVAEYDFRSFKAAGWTYRGGYTKLTKDSWADSIWSTIGIQADTSPADMNAQSGGWIRIKWPLIVGVCLILPIARIIKNRLARRREAYE